MNTKIFIVQVLLLSLYCSGTASADIFRTQKIDEDGVSVSSHIKAKTDLNAVIVLDHEETSGANQVISNFVYFDQSSASSELIKLSNWIVETGDNLGFPYMIIDKVHAQLLLFHSNGKLAGTTPILLGMAAGDKMVLGANQQILAKIKPADRVTPAGRFALEFGHNLAGKDIFWVDYEAAISLHRIIEGDAKERRGERIQSIASSDNRISYGCINVPEEFYEKLLRGMFLETSGFAYIMPEETQLKLPF